MNELRGLAAALLAIASSCASYVVPGRGADMQIFTPSNDGERAIAAAFERRPVAPFPATIALVRVQAPDYSSYSVRSTAGEGRYSVVTVRDIETDEHLRRLAAMPQVAGIAPMNRLLVPTRLDGAEELRMAAAELHADVVLVYTIDTVFRAEEQGGPIEIVSLGLLPTAVASVDTTASAILLDTRTGYLYGVAEVTERAGGRTNAWWSTSAIDTYRRGTERKSFERLLDEIERTWRGVVAQYAHPSVDPERASADGGG
jgi:hypothetical protein